MKKTKYLIRKRALGDVLWIEPIIRSLALKYKSLIVHTKYNELFDNYPLQNIKFKNKLSFIERFLILIEKRFNTSFISINLDGSYEKHPLIHFLNAYQLETGLPQSREYPQIYLTEDEKKRTIEDPYIVLHIESFSDKSYRQVYGINWNIVVSQLKAKGYKIFQVGLTDSSIIGTQNIKTNIRELISLIYNCDLFIGIDSGPSHIASSLGVNSIIFFGGIDPFLRHFPELLNGIILKQACANFNCFHKGIDSDSFICKALTDEGIPKCCLFDTEYIISKINDRLR